MPEQITQEQAKALQEKLKNMSPEELAAFQRENCIFCKIIHGEMETKKVFEDGICIATLDIAPASKGHLLIIPKEHYSVMPQVPDEVLGHMFVIAKRLSQVLLRALKVSGTNIFVANGQVAGQRSQHFMLHLIPRKEGDKILDINEKMITKEMQKNVKTSVERKLFDLMGVEPPRDVTPEKEKSSKEESSQDSVEEPEDLEQSPKKIIKKQTKKKTTKPKKELKVEVVDEKPEEEEDDDDVNLDNIADLFK